MRAATLEVAYFMQLNQTIPRVYALVLALLYCNTPLRHHYIASLHKVCCMLYDCPSPSIYKHSQKAFSDYPSIFENIKLFCSTSVLYTSHSPKKINLKSEMDFTKVFGLMALLLVTGSLAFPESYVRGEIRRK